MELSLFLAKWLGIYMLIVAADLIFRRRELEKAVRDFSHSKGLLVFSGSISLLIGLAIVIAHPVYEQDWRGLITFLGYLLVLRGIIRVAFPTHVQKRLLTMFKKGYWVILIVLIVLGIYLTHTGFNAVQ